MGVRKQTAQKSDEERFNLRKPNALEIRKQYQINISNRFAVLESLNDSENINRVWKNFKDIIKPSAKESRGLHELKQNKSWFD